MIEKEIFKSKVFYRRLTISLLSIIAIISSILVDSIVGTTFGYGMSYGTHLSIMGFATGSIFNFASLFIKDEKYLLMLNKGYFKGLVFVFIFVTGSVFCVVAYIPLIVTSINDPHGALIIINTTLLHVMVPLLALGEFLNNKKLTPTKSSFKEVSNVLLIFPFMYFVYVMLLISKGVHEPYPVFSFFNNVFDSGDKELIGEYISLVLMTLVIIGFKFVTYICFKDLRKNSEIPESK